MSERRSVFRDEWRRCLGEHYKQVVQAGDTGTRTTLVPIMYRAGFSEDELRQLYIEATMRSDQLPDDFAPDMEQASPTEMPQDDLTFERHPAECLCPSCMDTVLDSGHDEEGQPLADEPDYEEETEITIFPAVKIREDDEADDKPRQKSMF